MGNDSLAIARRAGLALSLMALGTLLILRLSSFIETHSNGESGDRKQAILSKRPCEAYSSKASSCNNDMPGRGRRIRVFRSPACGYHGAGTD